MKVYENLPDGDLLLEAFMYEKDEDTNYISKTRFRFLASDIDHITEFDNSVEKLNIDPDSEKTVIVMDIDTKILVQGSIDEWTQMWLKYLKSYKTYPQHN